LSNDQVMINSNHFQLLIIKAIPHTRVNNNLTGFAGQGPSLPCI